MLSSERPSHAEAKVETTLQTLLDSYARGLGPRVTPALKAQLRAEGLDLDHAPAVLPLDRWLAYRRRLAALAFPEAPFDEALRLLGLHFVRGWRKTALGAATSAVLGMLGPARTLTRLDRAFRTTDPFTHTHTKLVGPHDALVSIDDVRGDPTYWVGVLQGGLEVLRRDGAVVVHAASPPGVILRITWS